MSLTVSSGSWVWMASRGSEPVTSTFITSYLRLATEKVSMRQPSSDSSMRLTVFSPVSSKPRPSGQPGQEYQVSPAFCRPLALWIWPRAT